MKVGKLPVVNPFNLCIVVVGGSARNLKKTFRQKEGKVPSQVIKMILKINESVLKKLSLEKLAMSKSRCGVRS